MPNRRALALRSLAVLALASVMSACSSCEEPPAPAPVVPPPPPTLDAQSFTLPNGLDVDLVSGPCGDDAAIALLFEIGTDHDPAGRSGMAHVVERMLASSIEGPARTLAQGADHTLYSVVVPTDRLASELDDVAARVTRPEITEASVARARAAAVEDVASRHGGDAMRTATSFAAESVQPSRGGGWRGGIASELETIDVAAVEAFWRAHFGASNARLVVVGRFEGGAIRARIERAFGALPAGEAPVLREPGDSSVTGTIVMGDAPSALALAIAAPAPTDPLYPAFLIVASRLLGERSDAWAASYDPLDGSEPLLVTAPMHAGEPPESAASALRNAISAPVGRALTPDDVTGTRERFGAFLGEGALDPEACTADPRRLAVARARRAQLGLGELELDAALGRATQEQLTEIATLFEPRRSAAVAGGGAIR